MPSPTAWPKRRSASRFADCSRVRSRALNSRPLKKLIERMPPSRIGCCKLICESMLVSSAINRSYQSYRSYFLLRDDVPGLQLLVRHELHEAVLRRQYQRRLSLDLIAAVRANLHLRAGADALDDHQTPVLTRRRR